MCVKSLTPLPESSLSVLKGGVSADNAEMSLALEAPRSRPELGVLLWVISVWPQSRLNSTLEVLAGGTRRKICGITRERFPPQPCLRSLLCPPFTPTLFFLHPWCTIFFFAGKHSPAAAKRKWNCFLGSMAIPLQVNFQSAHIYGMFLVVYTLKQSKPTPHKSSSALIELRIMKKVKLGSIFTTI